VVGLTGELVVLDRRGLVTSSLSLLQERTIRMAVDDRG